ncbi:lithostathine-1-alpha-like [Ctenocephalides felis]|uniref:lithostathine-1-alpha-like n=1 Tax=Ctenocephalides felis TaxID=7515 RepID=UPI000E6E1E82|nr:lithostathine-1-alpha-like [Ctenocephalides felis]
MKLLFVFILNFIFLVHLTTVTTTFSTRDKFNVVTSPDGKDFYIYSNSKKTWHEAYRTCHDVYKGDLAAIENKGQSEALRTFFKEKYNNRIEEFWLSGNSLTSPQDGYLWYLTNPMEMFHQQWARGSPSKNTSGYCIYWRHDINNYGMVDVSCAEKEYFVCEKRNHCK